jgi:DNA-binding NtrC family response regulator
MEEPMYRHRILVIDDDPVFGQLLAGKGALRSMRIDYCATLVDAMYAYDLRRYDAAVVDCVMPEMHGLELAQYFRTFHRELPVILVSRARDQKTATEWRAAGAWAFVAKRRGLDAILDEVQRVA